MKIINNNVTVKMGEKIYNFHNLILNTYIKRMVISQQSDDITKWTPPTLSKCFVKFDKNLNFDIMSVLTQDDFDIYLGVTSTIEKKSTGGSIINYQYSLPTTDNWNNYIGKKIMALGFADLNNNFYACLDCSNYSLTIKQNEDISIARTDTFRTDAYFNSNNSNINYPVHLSIRGIPAFISTGTDDFPLVGRYAYAHLKSVGLGRNRNNMSKEIQINEDNVTYTDDSIIFNDLANGKIIEGLYYPASNKYPNSNKYPIKTGELYSYIFFKFEIYHLLSDFAGNNISQDSGYYYTLSVPINESGTFDYSIKYERA